MNNEKLITVQSPHGDLYEEAMAKYAMAVADQNRADIYYMAMMSDIVLEEDTEAVNDSI